MNRRAFLQRVSAGIVGASLAVKLPLEWIPAETQTYAACEYLRRAWFAHFDKYGAAPFSIDVGRQLFDAYADEIIRNYRTVVDDGRLMFKNTPVSEHGDGWWARTHVDHPMWRHA